jgi:hydrogenase maturation protease
MTAAALEQTTGILVLGIGNTLLSDEGVGVLAMKALAERLRDRAGIEFMDGGTLSFTLAGSIAEHGGLVVIDAAEMGAAPGSVDVFVGEDMDRFLGSNRKRSVHEVALIDLLAIALLEDYLPQQRALIAIQPGLVDWGDSLSPPVAAALDEVCDRAQQLIESWQA